MYTHIFWHKSLLGLLSIYRHGRAVVSCLIPGATRPSSIPARVKKFFTHLKISKQLPNAVDVQFAQEMKNLDGMSLRVGRMPP